MKKIAFVLCLVLSFSVSVQAQLSKGDILLGANFTGSLYFNSGVSGFTSIHPEFQYMFSKRFSAGLSTQFKLGGYIINGNRNLLLSARVAPELRFWFANSSHSRFSFYAYVNAGYSTVLWKSNDLIARPYFNYYSAEAGLGGLFWATPSTAIQMRVNILKSSTNSYDRSVRFAPSLQLGITKRISVSQKRSDKLQTLSFQ